MELFNSIPEVPLPYPIETTIPAPHFLSAINSTNTSTRPRTHNLNLDSLGDSGLATRSTSPCRLAMLATRPMLKRSTRCSKPNTAGSTVFLLPQGGVTNSSLLTQTRSPSVSPRSPSMHRRWIASLLFVEHSSSSPQRSDPRTP